MGSVRGKLALMLEGGLQAFEHFIEGISKLPDFTLGTFRGDARRQVSACADGLSSLPDLLYGKKSPPGDGITHQKRYGNQQRAGNQEDEKHGALYGEQGFRGKNAAYPEDLTALRESCVIDRPGAFSGGKGLEGIGFQNRVRRKICRDAAGDQPSLLIVNAENHSIFIEANIIVQLVGTVFKINIIHKIQDDFLKAGIGFSLKKASGNGKDKSKQEQNDQNQHAGIPESDLLLDGQAFSGKMFFSLFFHVFHDSILMTYPAPRTV